MTLPIIVVVGATGSQGSGVVAAFTSPAEASQYQIRALTSNTSSLSAQKLREHSNVSVAKVDLNSFESVVEAFQGASFIFANTIFHPETFLSEGPKAAQLREEHQGLNIVRAASEIPTLRHLIWSSLPDGLTISGGRYDIPHFQSKIPAEKYIWDSSNGKNLHDRTTVLRVGFYGSNLQIPPYHATRVEATKKLMVTLPSAPDALIPFIGDETINVGLIARSILTQPEKTLGRFVLGSVETMSCRTWVQTLAKVLQKKGQQLNAGFIECTLSSFEDFWGPVGTEIGVMYRFFEELGTQGYELDTKRSPILTLKDLGLEAGLRTTADRLLDLEVDKLV